MALTSLSYTSTAVSDLTLDKLKEIIHSAVTFNKEHNITGYLCIIENEGRIDSFAQWIEGEESDIDTCYNRVESSSSHTNIVVDYKGNPEQRRFKDWTLQVETVNSIAIKIFMYSI